MANLLTPEMVSNGYTIVCFNHVTLFRLAKKRSSSPLPYRNYLQLHPSAYILRPKERSEKHYTFIGEAYAHGWIDGEIMSKKEVNRTIEEFILV